MGGRGGSMRLCHPNGLGIKKRMLYTDVCYPWSLSPQ